MRLVLDTNVFLSALMSSDSPSAQIPTLWLSRKFDLLTTGEQLEEIARATRYPKIRNRLAPIVRTEPFRPARNRSPLELSEVFINMRNRFRRAKPHSQLLVRPCNESLYFRAPIFTSKRFCFPSVSSASSVGKGPLSASPSAFLRSGKGLRGETRNASINSRTIFLVQ